jgi:hypothetical protein
LAFLERTIDEVAEKIGDADLFAEVQRRVSEGWLILSIPQGRLKNISAHNLILDSPTLQLLTKLVEQGTLPYADCLSEIWVTDEKGKRLQDFVPALHEQMAKAILTNDFEQFAKAFVPKPRRQLRFSFSVESTVEKIVNLWRWSNMDAQALEVVKKAGRALAAIAASRKQPVLLYNLERVRSALRPAGGAQGRRSPTHRFGSRRDALHLAGRFRAADRATTPDSRRSSIRRLEKHPYYLCGNRVCQAHDEGKPSRFCRR